MLNIVSILIGVVALAFAIPGLIPLLGAINYDLGLGHALVFGIVMPGKADGLAGLMGCFHVVEEVHQHADAAGVDVEE